MQSHERPLTRRLMRAIVSQAFLALLVCPLSGEDKQSRRSNEDDLPEGAIRRIGKPGPKTKVDYPSVVFTPDGRTLVTGSWHHGIRLFSRLTGERLPFPPTLTGKYLYSLGLSADGRTIAASLGKGGIRLIDFATGRTLHTLRVDKTSMRGRVAFSPKDGSVSAACSLGRLYLVVWKPPADPITVQHEGRRFLQQLLYDFSLSPDGSQMVVALRGGGKGNRVELWDTATLRPIRTLAEEAAYSVAWTGDTNTIAVAFAGVKLFDATTGKQLADLSAPGQRDTRYLAASPDGKWLATTGNKWMQVWDVISQTEVQRMEHGLELHSIAFSPDSANIATGCHDGTVILWSMAPLVSKLTDTPTKALWLRLATRNGEEAFATIAELCRRPKEACNIFAQHLRPQKALEVRHLLTQLDAEAFAVREQAERRLRQLDLSRRTIERARSASRSAEVRQRLRRLLSRIPAGYKGVNDVRLREIRAIQVLERIGTTQARKVLETLARGDELMPLSMDSKAALGRLSVTGKKRP